MSEYNFILKFDVPENTDLETLSACLYEGGCDDAVIGIGSPGRISLDFTRESDSATNAVFSAISEVTKVLPTARLIEAMPDLVGLSDIAEILGCSRQYARKLVFNSRSAPLPFHEGNPTLWHLADMLNWLIETNKYVAEPLMLDLATLNKSINACRNYRDIDPEVIQQVENLVVIQSQAIYR